MTLWRGAGDRKIEGTVKDGCQEARKGGKE